jgi:putative sigma-54 modulation protein
MNLNFAGKDFEITDAIKNYANEKISKLEKYFGDNFDAVATLGIEGNEQVAEIRITVNGQVFKAVTASKDLYSSIDKDIDILEGQIRKSKSKKDKTNMTESIRLKEMAQAEDDEDVEAEVIKTLYYSIKPLTAEDAKLILQGDPKNKFLPFINVETDQVNVIYKLKDGKNFGLVEPEA